jgi:RNA polymerase sigma-70 factor, ECF subfamily
MTAGTDATLMLRFQEEGDYAAFEALYRRHKDALFAFLMSLAGNRAIAEDVSQHAWLRLIDVARRGAYAARAGVAFQTYLFTLARNHFVDQYRRKFDAVRTDSLEEAQLDERLHDDSEAADLVTRLDARQLAVQLREALKALPFEQREVVTLWASGFDLEAMAELTGAPPDTVLSRKKYALGRLRHALRRLIREREAS